MSLFKGERVEPLAVNYQPRNFPILPAAASGGTEHYYDSTQNTVARVISSGSAAGSNVVYSQYSFISNVAPVTATNPSAQANLMSVSMPANFMNAAGKTLRLTAYGFYTTASAQTPTINMVVAAGTNNLVSLTSAATTASATNMPFCLEADIVTQAVGTSGAVEAHGNLTLVLGVTPTAAAAEYLDQNTANTSLDVTQAYNLQTSVLMSSSNAGNSVVMRSLIVEVLD